MVWKHRTLGKSIVIAVAGVGVTSLLLTGCGSSATSEQVAPRITPTSAGEAAAEPTDDSSASESPTWESDDSTASATPTKSSNSPSSTFSPDTNAPLFVTSLPATVEVGPYRKIVVQIPTDSETRWKANVNGTATVSAVSFNEPPAEQPGAPGVSIATVTAPAAGIAYVNFILTAKSGGATLDTKRLEVVVE